MTEPDNLTTERHKAYAELKAADEDGLSATCFQLATRFLEANSKHIGALYYLGTSLVEMARYAEAEAVFLQILDICSDEHRYVVLTHLGHLHRQRLAPQQAEVWYRKAIEAEPDDEAGHIFLGALFAVQGRLDEAEACHRAALNCAEGDFDEAHYNLASVLRARGKYEESLAEAEAALLIDPNDGSAKHLIKDLLRILPQQPSE